MKTVSKIFFLSLLLMSGKIVAQSEELSTVFNKNGSYVLIELMNGASLTKGLLWKVTKDSLEYVQYDGNPKNIFWEDLAMLKIHYSEIKTLKTIPRGAIKKGILAGGLIGFSTGLAVGIATTEKPEPKTVAVGSGGVCFLFFCVPPSTQYVIEEEPRDTGVVLMKTAVFTGAGMLVGGILAGKKAVKATINGKKDSFLGIHDKLQEQSFWVDSQKLKIKEKNAKTI